MPEPASVHPRRRSTQVLLILAGLGGAGAGCDPALDVGTWLGAPAPPPSLPVVSPPPSSSGMDASVVEPIVDAGPPTPGTAIPEHSGDSGPAPAPVPTDAGGAPGEPEVMPDSGPMEPTLDAGPTCTFPADIDEPNPAQPRTWTTPLEVPWSTGFEDGFCAFAIETGYCLVSIDASYTTAELPVRSGAAAAAFAVATQDSVDGIQSRCVRRGVLPEAAYYSAWYFVPALAQTNGNWNLFHFRGGDGEARHGLWDISLHNGDDGQLYLHLFDQFTLTVHNPAPAVALPIGQWVHIQVYLRRSAQANGEVALYQDGQLLLRLTDLVTDDTTQGAWYVGNFAEDLTPPELTVYVDDVAISETL